MTINGAFDTETINGNIIVLANSKGKYVLSPSIDDCLSFLVTNKHERRYFTYNLRFDVDGILKMLPLDKLSSLLKDGKCIYKDYKLTYIGKGIFNIARTHVAKNGKVAYAPSFYVWDITQFYFWMSLDAASKKYLDRDNWKTDSFVISNFKTDGNNIDYFYKHESEIIEYCIQDARATKLLADRYQTLCDEQGYDFTRPYSVGNLGIKYAKSALQEPPQRIFSKGKYTVNEDVDIKKYKEYRDLENVFSFVARGGWNDVYKRGRFKEVWDYDIVSAYPLAMYQCPYWDGEWKSTKKVLASFSDESYGVVTCEIKNLSIPVLPYVYQYLFENHYAFGKTFWLNHSVIWSVSKNWIGVTLPLDMFIYIKDYCEYKNLDIIYLDSKNKGYPLRSFVDDIFSKKKEAKIKYGSDSIDYKLPKGIMNSVTGKFKQKQHTNYTWFYYPHLYSKITWNTKRKVIDVLNKNNAWDNLISVSTDGITLSKPLKHINIGNKMGNWEYKKMTDYVSIGNGIYYGDTDNGLNWKARGYNLKIDGNKVTIKDIMNVKDNMHKDKIEVKIIRPIHLRESFVHNKTLKISDTNRFVPVIRYLNINQEIKRKWNDKFIDISDMLSGRIISSTSHDAAHSLSVCKDNEKNVSQRISKNK